MQQRPQAFHHSTAVAVPNDAEAERADALRPSWETEMAELMARMSPDNREALLRIARAMVEL